MKWPLRVSNRGMARPSGARWIVLLLGGISGACKQPAGIYHGSDDSGPYDADGAVVEEADPCDSVFALPDSDGDGRHGGGSEEEGVSVCVGDPIPVGFAVEGRDCDDENGAVWETACFDRDGDRGEVYGCIGSEPPADVVPCPVVVESQALGGSYDCDDSDPLRNQYRYRDADHDGIGTGEMACVPYGVGWSTSDRDCDDDDATRTPGAFDIYGDGIDSDCDGNDQGWCGSPELEDFEWPANSETPCGGTDLALGVRNCSGCGSSNASLAVENRGNVAVNAELLLVTEHESGQQENLALSVRLEVGQRKLLVSGRFSGEVVMELVVPVTDCRPADNRQSIAGGHCI